MSAQELNALREQFTGTNIFLPLGLGAHVNERVKPFGLQAAGKKAALHTSHSAH